MQRREEKELGLFLSYACGVFRRMGCSARWEAQSDKTRQTGTSQVMLGQHQRLSAVPGAVSISSVPPPRPTAKR